jgi:hypothetical protein
MIPFDRVDNDSCSFENFINEIEIHQEETNSVFSSELDNSMYLSYSKLFHINVFFFVDLGLINVREIIDDEGDNLVNTVEKDFMHCMVDAAATGCSGTNADSDVANDIDNSSSKVKKKRKNIDEPSEENMSNSGFEMSRWSPPARRLRSKKRLVVTNDDKMVTGSKKKLGSKK